MHLTNSLSFFERAKKVIPLASQTISKSHLQLSVGAVPLFAERAKGGHIWDIDGNEYIDFIMGLGPFTLGYGNEEVDRAVVDQMKKGTLFSLAGKLETELAEKICSIIPGAEMVRYGKNGSDATTGAVRIARAYTGRDMVMCAGYHGWHDWYVGTTGRNKGVPETVKALTKTFVYNDLASVEKLFAEFPNQFAAVVLEPISMEYPKDNFLQKLKDLAHKHGAVLIFDEMVTGFRLALGGAQEKFGVSADLACFGKGVGNGYPVAFVCGRREIMKECEQIFFSFTFGGELVSLAAAQKTIEIMERDNVCAYLNTIGQELQDAHNTIAKELGLEKRTWTAGYGSHHLTVFKDESGADDLAAKTVFQEVMAENGVLTLGSNNTSFAHTKDDVAKIRAGIRAGLTTVADGIAKGDLESRIRGTKLQARPRKD